MGYYGGMRKLLLLFAFFLPVPQSSSCCDLNGDGVVNVADVQIEINAALGIGTGGILPVADAPTAGPPFSPRGLRTSVPVLRSPWPSRAAMRPESLACSPVPSHAF